MNEYLPDVRGDDLTYCCEVCNIDLTSRLNNKQGKQQLN
jgi:hypothetical protein